MRGRVGPVHADAPTFVDCARMSSSSRRGATRGGARLLLAALVLSLGLPGCGDAPPPGVRRVVPLVDAPPLRTLAPEHEEPLELALAEGEAFEREVALDPAHKYTVEVRFDGVAPTLLAADLGEGDGAGSGASPVPPLPGEPPPGLVVGILRPESPRVRLRVVPGGAVTLRGVTVRRWGAAGGLDTTAGDAWAPVGVYGDHRVARIVEPNGPFACEAEVPVGASRLEFDVVCDPRAPVEVPAPDGLVLRVVVAPRGAERGEPVRVPVRPSRASWQAVEVPVDLPPGTPVDVRVAVVAPDAASAEAVAVSVPRWHCTRGPHRPNLVLISLDTTRPDHLGFHGYARDTSPQLDALAARSVVFEAAQSTAPYTLPSHATMFTGQYPTTHGAEHPAQAVDGAHSPLLAAVLAEAGYATRAFTGGGYLDADFGFAEGFHAYGNNDPVIPVTGRAVADIENASAAGRRYVEARRAQHWDAAVDWAARHDDVPFFLFLQTFAIHDYRPEDPHRSMFGAPAKGEGVVPLRHPPDQVAQPYTPEELAQLTDLYDAAIHEVDALVGRLVHALREAGVAGHTVIVVTADHGEDFGEHAVEGSPFVGHGQGLWQTLLHVPLVITAPGVAPRRVSRRVSLVDLAPTALDLLGVPAPPAMQGRSLRPLMETGEGAGSPVLSELHSHRGWMRSLVVDDDLKVVTGDPDALVSWPVTRPVRLFRLSEDPVERADLEPGRPDEARDLADAVRALGEALEAERAGAPRGARPSEATLRRLEELGYVDG